MSRHGPVYHDIATSHFVEEDVLIERAKDDKKTPLTETQIRKPAARSKLQMLCERRGEPSAPYNSEFSTVLS